MIDFLKGKLAYREAEYVVLDVQGVGYRLFCANPLDITHEEGQEITLYAHHHVREDAVTLYGFQSRAEQALFRKLLIVNGIGPRVALGILSIGRPEAIVSAIYQEDINFLIRLPGIGRKTAQRIILDLKDKLADQPMMQVESGETAGSDKTALSSAGREGTTGQEGMAWREAKMALSTLGFSETETDRLWPLIRTRASEGADAEALVKLALQRLYKA